MHLFPSHSPGCLSLSWGTLVILRDTHCWAWPHLTVVRQRFALFSPSLLSPLFPPQIIYSFPMPLSFYLPIFFIVYQIYFTSCLIKYDSLEAEVVISALTHKHIVPEPSVDKPEPKRSCMIMGVTKFKIEF